jgi:23S rRNA pseudouridine2457 synthase
MNAAMLGRLNIMFHVADEERFVGLELVFGEDVVDFFAFVPNVGIGFFKKGVEVNNAALHGIMVGVNGAQEERAEFFRAAEFQKIARVRQLHDGGLSLLKAAVKPVFELRHWDVRRVAVVKFRERQGKFRAELLERHFRFASLLQNKIRGFQDGGQIVHQGSGPVEDDVADHEKNLTTKAPRHQVFVSLCVLVFLRLKIIVLIAFNKPFGVLSQFTGDGSANRTFAEFGFPKNVYSIGRLDADSEGLLLLSDEPAWNEKLLHPRHAHEREYWAQVEKIPSPESLKKLEKGILIQGRKTLPCRAWLLEPQPEIPPRVPPIRFRKNVPDCWIGLELIEGKNRQARKMTAAIGHPTLRLMRVRIGNLWLGNLSVAKWRVLEKQEFVLIDAVRLRR